MDNSTAAQGKSYAIHIEGQRNAQRQLFGETTRLRFVLRIIEELTITAQTLPTTFGKKLALFICELPVQFQQGRVSLIIKESDLNKFDFAGFYHTMREKSPSFVFKHFAMQCDYRTVN